MKLFYDACHSATVHAKEGNTFGTLLWLETAQRHQRRLMVQARARFEPALLGHLQSYFQTTLRSVELFWAKEPAKAIVEQLVEETALHRWMADNPPLSTWDRRILRGSLAHRWSEYAQAAH